ncbi:RNase P modulator RnpM [Lacticaseibacillus zhaodongensis]|uniref:RNase P modulator RnpM n=1 Tax=Lacticaseibacillus zhaodongensis TaxID=2668065 RepID=UPI0012D2DA6B|nr:YlxR family protein [Lacticaseibacillus zhaodongensis]
MKPRKVPMRKDLLTGEMHPKKEMVRIVKLKDDTLEIDPSGKKSGRGAYVALNPDGVKAAAQKHVLESAFGIKVDAQFYDDLFAYVDHQKARRELFGDKA